MKLLMGAIVIADVDADVMQHELVSSTMQVVIPQRSMTAEAKAQAVPEVEETVLAPSRGWIAVNWRELIRDMQLLYFLVWRDIKVRYKQAMLGRMGGAAAVVQHDPVHGAVLAAGEFSERLGPALGPAYAVLFVFVAMVPWQIFSTGLNDGGMSLINQHASDHQDLLPRLFVPSSVVGGACWTWRFLDLVVALMALV